MLAFRCTVRFLPEAALLLLCSRVNLPDLAPSCCFETVTWVRPVSTHSKDYSMLGSILGSPYFGKLPYFQNMHEALQVIAKMVL